MSVATSQAAPTTLVRVDYEEMYRLAAVWTQTAEDVGRVAFAVAMIAAEPNLGDTLDPVGAFRTKHRLIDVLMGPGGLSNLVLRLETDAVKLHAVVVKESVVDNFPTSELRSLHQWVVAAPIRLVVNPKGALTDGVGRFRDAAQGTVTYVLPVLDDVASFAHQTGPAGSPLFRALGDAGVTLGVGFAGGMAGAGAGAAIPTAVGATMSAEPIGSLAQALATIGDLYDGPEGTIAIQAVSSHDGATRYVIELPGAEAVTSSHPQNLVQAGGALLSSSSAYSRAVVSAMRTAAVPVGAEVMLVGHSEGGIVAMNLAGDTAFNGGYVKVTHVVAAGSPISSKQVAAGSGTRVLSVENMNDAVVHADLKDSGDRPASADRLTYQFSDDHHDLTVNHHLTRYAERLALIEGGPNPRMGTFVASASKYLDGPVSTQTFVLFKGAFR